MARPTLDDDRYLLEVAIVLCSYEGMKFAQAVRLAKPRMGEINNYQSEDSFRRRLQRKWGKNQTYWRETAIEETKLRRQQQIEQGIESMRRFAAGVSENIAPMMKGIHAAVNSPAMQEMFETIRRVEKQMQIVRMPAIEAANRIQKQHDAIMQVIPRGLR